MHLAMASTVEAQIAEVAKSLSKTESCDRKPVIDLQMPASGNLAVNRNINQLQRLMRGHGAAKMRHTYTLVWRSTATFICGVYATPDYLRARGGGGGGGKKPSSGFLMRVPPHPLRPFLTHA